METLKAFAEKVQSDESLQNEIKKLNEANDQEGLIALAKSNGVSEEGIKHMKNNDFFNKHENIEDKELDSVAGGVQPAEVNGAVI